MKKLIAAFALTLAAGAVPALAADVGVSIRLGEPGFYGQLDIDSGYRPRLIYAQPVLIERRYRNLAPIYLRVPPGHARNWARFCDRYNACARPVYFVRDDWYRDVYAPRYRQLHSRDWQERRDDGRDNRRYDDNRRYEDNRRSDDRHDDHHRDDDRH